MDGPGTLGARVAREYRECKDDDFGNIGVRGGFHAKAQSSQRGELVLVGFNTKTEGDEESTWGLMIDSWKLQNVKWPTSLITRHQPITID